MEVGAGRPSLSSGEARRCWPRRTPFVYVCVTSPRLALGHRPVCMLGGTQTGPKAHTSWHLRMPLHTRAAHMGPASALPLSSPGPLPSRSGSRSRVWSPGWAGGLAVALLFLSSFLPPLLLSSSASLWAAPAALSPLRGSEFSLVAPATQVTHHSASGTHSPISHPGVPHRLRAAIWGQADLWRLQPPSSYTPGWAGLDVPVPLWQPWARGSCRGWNLPEGSRAQGGRGGWGGCERGGATWRMG